MRPDAALVRCAGQVYGHAMDHTDIPFEDCMQGDEGQMLLFALDRVHRQFAWKSGGLTAEQLHQRHAPSRLTIAGTMVNPVARVGAAML